MPTTPHFFGGDWTDEKLERVRQYLVGYTTALKNTRFRIAYIDAFAGTGYRKARSRRSSEDVAQVSIPGLPPEYYERDSQKFLDGSARIALQVEPPFHKYIFIENHPKRFAELEKLKDEFPDKRDNIRVEPEDANAYLQRICRRKENWRTRRAVVFLDPYGMQVEWQTIKALGDTKAIDLWILFPLGVAVNRMVTRDGKINEAWRKKLDIMFGDTGWYDVFYREFVSYDLLGERAELKKVADFNSIGQYFVTRLKTVFYQVAENPRPLLNSRNNPLYLLCFATGNPRGAPIAMRIADHILKN